MVPVTTSVTLDSFKFLGDILSTSSTGVPRVRVIVGRFNEVAHRVTDFCEEARPSLQKEEKSWEKSSWANLVSKIKESSRVVTNLRFSHLSSIERQPTCTT